MAVDVIMPQMGESIFEGTITKWLKKPGDKIERDEPLFEISTDKVDAEIPAPSAGVLKEIKVKEGQTVPVQTVVALIDAAGAAEASAPAPAKAEAPKSTAAPSAPAKPAVSAPPPAPRPAPTPAAAAPEDEDEDDESAGLGEGDNGHKVRSSPLVRRIARENNIDLSQISGTGAGGRVSKRDILAAVETGGAPTAAPAPLARSSAPPPATASAASGALEPCRSAREALFRPLRRRTHVRNAAEDRRAHGAFQARFAARLLGGRSGSDRRRVPTRQDQGKIRTDHRDEAHIYAVLHSRGRRGAARLSHGECFCRRHQRRAASRM